MRKKNKTLVINLFAGPGAGKTVAAYLITAELKKRGYNVEYVSEFAKELVYQEKFDLLKDQVFVTDTQQSRLEILRGKVDIIVTDSPPLLGKVYGEDRISKAYSKKISDYHKTFPTFNLYIERGADYQSEGRIENFEEAKKRDSQIKKLLSDEEVFYGNYKHESIDLILDNIIKTYDRINKINTEQQFDNKWKSLVLPAACFVDEYAKGIMFRIPKSAEYGECIFFHAKSLVKKSGQDYILKFTEDFNFKLKNDKKQQEVTIPAEKMFEIMSQYNKELKKAPKYKNDKKYEQNIPYALRDTKTFACFQLQWLPDAQRYDKVPKNPFTGANANPNDPKTWGTFEDACKAVDVFGFDGINMVLTGGRLDHKGNPMPGTIAIDIDHCFDKTEEQRLFATSIIDKMKTYTELSPSGSGVHIIFIATPPSKDDYYIKQNGLEILSAGHFITLTGNNENYKEYTFKGQSDEQRPMMEIYDKYMKRPERYAEKGSINSTNLYLSDNDVIELIKKGGAAQKFENLYNGSFGADQSVADISLCGILAYYTQDSGQIDRIFRSSALMRKKWEKKIGSSGTYGEMTITQTLKNQTKTYNPAYAKKMAIRKAIEEKQLKKKSEKEND